MAHTPITDTLIEEIIKSTGAYDPEIETTQGIRLQDLVKLIRDHLSDKLNKEGGTMTGPLELAPGTSNNAPLKLTPGGLTTVPQDGALERGNDGELYFTKGTERKKIGDTGGNQDLQNVTDRGNITDNNIIISKSSPANIQNLKGLHLAFDDDVCMGGMITSKSSDSVLDQGRIIFRDDYLLIGTSYNRILFGKTGRSSFSGKVSGVEAEQPDEFVIKSQLDAAIGGGKKWIATSDLSYNIEANEYMGIETDENLVIGVVHYSDGNGELEFVVNTKTSTATIEYEIVSRGQVAVDGTPSVVHRNVNASVIGTSKTSLPPWDYHNYGGMGQDLIIRLVGGSVYKSKVFYNTARNLVTLIVEKFTDNTTPIRESY